MTANKITARGPLHGVRVLEFSLIFSAPFAGVHLSDLGAEVIKVEQLGGEPFRNLGTPVPGHGKSFQWANRGKRSLTLDLSKAEGVEVVRRLLPSTDVVLINYRAGVAKRLGIDYESLRKLKPDLIYADINGFGTEGPLADQPASDMVAQAYGGTVAIDGKLAEDGAPDWPSIPIGDLTTGIATAMGICAALFHRAQTGEGQYVSISLLRVVMHMAFQHMMIEPVNDAVLRDFVKAEVERVRAAGGSYDELVGARQVTAGRGSPMSIYWRGYRAKDGGIVLGALTAANRDAIRRVVGIEGDPTDEPGYDGTDPRNHELVEQIKERVREIMLTRTVGEWMREFRAAGAPAAEVMLPEDLPDDPQAGLHMIGITHEITGPQRIVRPLVDMSATPTGPQCASPIPGHDNDSVLREWGGYSVEEVATLRTAGVID